MRAIATVLLAVGCNHHDATQLAPDAAPDSPHASCAVQVAPDDSITVLAATPDDFVTFSAPCQPTLAECYLPVGTASVAATFHALPGERDVFPLVGSGPIVEVFPR
jgi:hypothetical protein